MGRTTTWWTWVRDWAGRDHARLQAFLEVADRWPLGKLGRLALREMDVSPREGLASLLEDARGLGRERFLRLLDALVPGHGAHHGPRTTEDVAAVWMAAEPLFRQWAARSRRVLGEGAPKNDVRLLHECGGVVPWDKRLGGSDEARRARQLEAIRDAYEPRGGSGDADIDTVTRGVYWAVTHARNEQAHGATVSLVRGRVDALDLSRDVVALLILGYLRHRRWVLAHDGEAPPLADAACVDDGPERLPLRPPVASGGSRSPRCCKWLPVVMLVAVGGALGALALSYATPDVLRRSEEAPRGAGQAPPPATPAPAPRAARGATACDAQAQGLVGRWALATFVGHAWERYSCALGTRGYYDLEITASPEDGSCTFKVWVTKRGYIDSCNGDRVHDYGKKPRDGAAGRLLRLPQPGSGGPARAILARLDVGADRGLGSGRRYLFVPCGAGRLCGFWQTRGKEWERYGYSGFLVARRGGPGGVAALDVARGLAPGDGDGLPVEAVRCLAQCARGVVPQGAEGADEHWRRCRARCGLSGS